MAVRNTSKDILRYFSTISNTPNSKADSELAEKIMNQSLTTSELKDLGSQIIDAGRLGQLQPIYENLDSYDNDLHPEECADEEERRLVFETKNIVKENKAVLKTVTKGKDVWDEEDQENIGRMAQGNLLRLRSYLNYVFCCGTIKESQKTDCPPNPSSTTNNNTLKTVLKWLGIGVLVLGSVYGAYCFWPIIAPYFGLITAVATPL